MTTQTLDITATILAKVRDLPTDKQQQILDYVEFITSKYDPEKSEHQANSQTRIAGLHAGKIWISDDFNDPLSDDLLGV